MRFTFILFYVVARMVPDALATKYNEICKKLDTFKVFAQMKHKFILKMFFLCGGYFI